MKRLFAVLGVSMLLFGCAGKVVSTETTAPSSVMTETTKEETVAKSQEEKTNPKTSEQTMDSESIVFTDDVGRKVTIPKNIKTIGAAGNPAAFVLYNIAPEMLVGWPAAPGESAKAYYLKEIHGISEWGAMFGKKSNLNKEELLRVKPDVLIDFGQAKKNIATDLDTMQSDVNIPIIFIKGDLADMTSGITKLGKLLGKENEAKELALFIQHASEVASNSAKEANKSFYMGGGDAGLNTNHAGNVKQAALEIAGMKNVIVLDDKKDRGGNEVSFEELLQQNPECLLFEEGSIFDNIKEMEGWNDLEAVKNLEVYRIPTVGISWVGGTPTTNQVLGLLYASYINTPSLITKKEFAKDIVEYYRLFLHYEMSEDEAMQIIDTLKMH